jgi:hypothetical protein
MYDCETSGIFNVFVIVLLVGRKAKCTLLRITIAKVFA